MCHLGLLSCAIGAQKHVADGADGAMHTALDVIGGHLDAVETSRGAFQLDGEASAVVLHELELGLQVATAMLDIEAPRDRDLESSERRLQALERVVQNRH